MYQQKDQIDKCLEWINSNHKIAFLSPKDIIALTLEWADEDITKKSEKELVRRVEEKKKKEEEENNRADYTESVDDSGNTWYHRQHWYHQRPESRKLKVGDIIHFHSNNEDGVMLIKSFDYESDFAARSYYQLYYWNEKLGFSQEIQPGYDMAPGIESFSLATEKEIENFFKALREDFPEDFKFYFLNIRPECAKNYVDFFYEKEPDQE